MKNKNKQITRKEFIIKTSKVAGGIVLCPALISSLSSCSDPASSSADFCDINSDGLITTCANHGAQFNTDGCPVSGPTMNNLTQYTHQPLEGNILTIIDGDNTEDIDISQEGNGALLSIGGSILHEGSIIGSVLIYRKSEEAFKIFSTVCPHANGPLGEFV